MYLAVLPQYRRACIDELRMNLGPDLAMFVSESHLDETVKTGIDPEYYGSLPMVRLAGRRFFLQTGHWVETIHAEGVVVDLNPRSLTSWGLLFARKILNRHTVVWGHLYAQAGPGGPTAILRKMMRKLASGTVLYSYADAERAIGDLPGKPIWVAPNSLYQQRQIEPAATPDGESRNDILYVGRLEPAKKVDLAIRAFALLRAEGLDAKLTLIGSGSALPELRELAADLNVIDDVEFKGWVDDRLDLVSAYSKAFCSVSPGFAGLGLTQSLGFGIPMIVAREEPHSPEIELASSGGVTWFTKDSPESMKTEMLRRWRDRDRLPSVDLSEYVKSKYSAEQMAEGLSHAIRAKAENHG